MDNRSEEMLRERVTRYAPVKAPPTNEKERLVIVEIKTKTDLVGQRRLKIEVGDRGTSFHNCPLAFYKLKISSPSLIAV